MDKEFGMQELYSVLLKTTYPIEIKGKQIQQGEVIAAFDKVQIANFNDIHKEVAAQGGYQNRKLLIWNRTEGVKINFTQGIFSKTQLSLMINAQLARIKETSIVKITQRDEIETNSEGIITLSHKPIDNYIFVYNKETGEKLSGLTMISSNEIQTPLVYKDVIVDYEYGYDNGADINFIGEDIFETFISLEGRTRIKDDVTGETHTAIIYIPKLKITSDFNLVLGEQAQPMVGQFQGIALPVGDRGYSRALEIYYLEDDIDKDSEWR